MRMRSHAGRFTAALFAISCLPATTALANPQTSSTSGQASAQVVAPLAVTRQDDLAFGAVFSSKTTGSVTVSADGTIAYSGGAKPACIGGACDDAHPGTFSVVGEPGRAYVVQVPSEVIASGSTIGGQGTAPPLTVDGLNAASANGASGHGGWQLDQQGRDSFEVGGTLHLPADLPSARYRATIPVIVVYG